MLDLLIRGGEVVTPQGVIRCDVAVAGEIIAAIAAPDALPAQTAHHLIDAAGHIVMPGGIEPHVHLHHVWIKPDGTPLITAGPEQVGRAAIAAMVSPAIATSHLMTPCGVTTSPPRMRRSSINPPGHCGG